MSLRLRFTVLAAASVSVIVVVVGVALYLVFAEQLRSQVDQRLEARAAFRGAVVVPQRSAPAEIRVPGRSPGDATFFLAVDRSGGVLFRSANAGQLDVRIPDDARRTAAGGGRAFLTVTSGGQDYRLLVTSPGTGLQLSSPDAQDSQPAASPRGAAPSPAAQAAPGDARLGQVLLVTGQSLQGVGDALRPLRLLLAGGALVSLSLGAAAGWLVARRALRPVTRLSSAVDHIGADGDLARRLPEPGGRDEVAVLTHGFNASLDRIEAAYRELETLLERQRRFVADASHELRTPLTTLRSDIALLRRHPGMPGDERRALVERSLAEVERMSRLAADLLALARGEAGALEPRGLDLDELSAELGDDVRRLCHPRPVEVSLAPLGAGTADPDAVRRMVRVLAENVARHTPTTTRVRFSVSRHATDMVIGVEDDGPGVDAELIPVIFDRFVRGDRARAGAGTGLGLAIARSVVEAHGGSIAASLVEPHGLRIEMTIPAGGDPPPPPEGAERPADVARAAVTVAAAQPS